jgi:hypothetical protein
MYLFTKSLCLSSFWQISMSFFLQRVPFTPRFLKSRVTPSTAVSVSLLLSFCSAVRPSQYLWYARFVLQRTASHTPTGHLWLKGGREHRQLQPIRQECHIKGGFNVVCTITLMHVLRRWFRLAWVVLPSWSMPTLSHPQRNGIWALKPPRELFTKFKSFGRIWL